MGRRVHPALLLGSLWLLCAGAGAGGAAGCKPERDGGGAGAGGRRDGDGDGGRRSGAGPGDGDGDGDDGGDRRPAAVLEVMLPPAPEPAGPPTGLPERPELADHPTTPEKVALGELLFFDARLSAQDKLSCADCHLPERGFSDGRPRSGTHAHQPNLRHTPALINLAYHREFYWDGRSLDLEGALLSHWRGQLGVDPARVAQRLAAIPDYRAYFSRAFGAEPGPETAASALAAFVRVLHSGDSAWDRYEAGARAAASPQAVAGFRVFSERAGCAVCHTPPLYTDLSYHARGIGERGAGGAPIDGGRQRVTGRVEEVAAFKTPTLRGALYTAPYFHDGSVASLTDAVAHELGQKELTAPLTAEERQQLLAFLAALSPAPPAYVRPRLPMELPLGLDGGDDSLGIRRELPPIIEDSGTR